MQENNFERKVNELMEGFTVEPSQEVWQKLQPQIAKRERRKRGIFFLLALLLCLIAGGVFINDINKKKANGAITEAVNKNRPADGDKQKVKEPAGVVAASANKTGAQKNIAVVPVEKNTQRNTIATSNKQQDHDQKENLFTAGKIKVNTRAAVIMEVQNAGVDETVTQPVNIVEEKLNSTVAGNDKRTGAATSVNVEQKESNTTINTVGDKKKASSEKKTEIITASTKNAKQANNEKWKFALNFAAGVTATSKSYLSNKANDEYKNLFSNDGTGNGTTGSPSRAAYSPSPVKPGLSFTAGFAAIKQLSARTVFSAGLAYKYASTSVATGQTIQSSSQNAIDSILQGSNNTYSNHYHFIELPIEIQSMIGKGKKLPLYWNAGLNTSLLLHSNVLQFQSITGRYYADNSTLNKIQLGISAGLIVNVLNKKYPPLLIGPSVYYSLTTIAGKGLYQGTHYSFAGIRIQKQLNKK